MNNVNLDPQGRFAFVELRTEELATQALALDKARAHTFCHTGGSRLRRSCFPCQQVLVLPVAHALSQSPLDRPQLSS